MSVVSLDQLLSESTVYMNLVEDYLFFSSIHHNHPVLVQLPVCRAMTSKNVMKILTIDPNMRIFEEQVAAYTETKQPDTNIIKSENHIHTSFNASTCQWFDEENKHIDISKMPHANLLSNNEFTCVPIVAIHGVNLATAIHTIDYEIMQVKYMHFRPPSLPDLSKPLFI